MGNIGSGKSSFIKSLQAHFSAYTPLCLDEYRKAAEGQGMQREHAAINQFLVDLKSHDRLIYETTAYGKTYQLARRLLSKANVKVIPLKLVCSPEVCHKRFLARTEQVPFPYKFNIWDSLWRIHTNLKSVVGHELDSEHFTSQELIEQVL